MFLKKRSKKLETRQRPPQTSGTKAVFSYYSGKSRSETDSEPRKRKVSAVKKLRRVVLSLLIVSALAGMLYSLIVSDSPSVSVDNDRQTAQALLKDPEVYANAAAQLIEGSPFNRNKLTFDAAGLSAELEKQFPEVADVVIELPLLGHDPILHISAYKPHLVMVNQNSAYIIDRQGKVAGLATQVDSLSNLGLPVVKDESGLELDRGQLGLPAAQVEFISEVFGQLKNKGVKFTNMILPPGGSDFIIEVEGAPYSVRFNLYGKAREQAGRYLAVREYFKTRDAPGQYVDVRLDNRVYYR